MDTLLTNSGQSICTTMDSMDSNLGQARLGQKTPSLDAAKAEAFARLEEFRRPYVLPS